MVLIVLMMFILHTIQANVTKKPISCLSTRQLTYDQHPQKRKKIHSIAAVWWLARLVL